MTDEHAKMFVTASVEMWQRAIHSFLVSVANTKSSPIWASVSAYYASHYVARAYSHLYGYFGLSERGILVAIDHEGGKKFSLEFVKGFAEHDSYWPLANKITASPLFVMSKDKFHRGYANYRDHVDGIAPSDLADLDFVKSAVASLSRQDIELPSEEDEVERQWQYPNVAWVQGLALHRVVHFRTHVDALVKGKSAFWRLHRDPNWAHSVMKYDLSGRLTGAGQPSI